jgi:hypothetical protein
LRRITKGKKLFELLEQRNQFGFDQNEFSAIKKLMLRYRNIPMDLADACLVRMHELIIIQRF